MAGYSAGLNGRGVIYEYPRSVLDVSSNVVVPGNVTVSSSIVFSSNASLTVTGTLTILPGASAVLSGTQSGTVVFVMASSISGQFQNVTGTNCTTVQNVVYSSSTVSALLQVGCGLSTGEIVGIAVGAAVGGALIILFVVFVIWMCRKKSDKAWNKTIRQAELQQFK